MVRVGMLGSAHVHAPSYLRCVAESGRAVWSGVWDADPGRAEAASRTASAPVAGSIEELVATCDAVVAAGTNVGHAEIVEAALSAGRWVLCEKPLAATRDELKRIESAVARTPGKLMTAFPCPFSPVFRRLVETVQSGALGTVVSVSATNRGTCPGGWFVDPAQSGGGAVVDHTVHVADLLARLLGGPPLSVSAVVGSNRLGLDVEDTAFVSLAYPGGAFATIDASWSRPEGYRTWGDVTLAVSGTEGTAEADLFGQGFQVFDGRARHRATASDLDRAMVGEFLSAVVEGRPPSVTAEDGLAASRVMLAAYASVRSGQPEAPA
jgi:predicted dehydrogenase